jgi:kynurenine formamidase
MAAMKSRKAKEPKPYRDHVVVDFLGRKTHVLDLSHIISPTMPIYPGHAKVALWPHLSHAESRQRLGPGRKWCGYGVTGITMCDHVSTHIDAIYHFNEKRPDLSIEKLPLGVMITPGYWIDLSGHKPRTSIPLAHVKAALRQAGIRKIKPGSSLLYWTGAERLWNKPLEFNSQYPGLDAEASHWILDQGVVNVLTDAASTDNPADLDYPNHLAHSERLINHTEILRNIRKIPVHQGFSIVLCPLKFEGATGSPVRILALWH